ncbi:MAG: ABC transporter ATP-binding protein, partial [Comamonadaceae bacterium]|nr:ABC transporter ATP-binding protein [Comamonadaceae bacterium]
MSLSVRFNEVVKDFGAVRVLHGVSFDLAPGRMVGLLGENGAGKSTLMKILSGYEALSGGSLEVDGVVRRFASSREAEEAGIVLIHQEFNLADDLTVAQNIFLGRETHKGWLLDEAGMRRAAREVLQQVGLDIDPDTRAR